MADGEVTGAACAEALADATDAAGDVVEAVSSGFAATPWALLAAGIGTGAEAAANAASAVTFASLFIANCVEETSENA